jgi:sugar lactone lactonase YvrE
VRLDADSQGFLSNLAYFAEKGEFSAIPDSQGNVYVADGEIYIYDKEGKQTGMIRVPERPSTLVFGGKDHKMLFVTGRSALYKADLSTLVTSGPNLK